MVKITTDMVRLMHEVQDDPVAYAALQRKAGWEGMTLFGVLDEWGDPRQWPSVAAARAEEREG